jgi:hypothetical protein
MTIRMLARRRQNETAHTKECGSDRDFECWLWTSGIQINQVETSRKPDDGRNDVKVNEKDTVSDKSILSTLPVDWSNRKRVEVEEEEPECQLIRLWVGRAEFNQVDSMPFVWPIKPDLTELVSKPDEGRKRLLQTDLGPDNYQLLNGEQLP